MKKIKKLILISIAAVIILLIIVVAVVALNLDSIVKKGVVTVGPQITKVPIDLDSIHIGLFSGSAKINGLVVGNPDGYKSTNAISVSLAEVSISPGSILADKIVIHSIHVVSPEITFEGGLTDNNLKKILNNVNGTAAAGGPPKNNDTTTSGGKPAKKLEVDEFIITGAKVHVNLTGLVSKQLTLTLPDINLPALGTGPDGITPTDLTAAVLQAVTTDTLKAVAESAADLGKDATKAAGKAVNENVNKLKTGLGGLLGK